MATKSTSVEQGFLAMQLACMDGDLPTLKFLIAINICPVKVEFLSIASENGHIDIVQYLSEFFMDMSDELYTPTLQAAWNGQLDVLMYLFAIGANVRMCKKEASYGAKLRGHAHIVMYLDSFT